MVLHVLVNESSPGAAAHASSVLEAHGHRIVRCHEPGDTAFPCAALHLGHVCPLEGGVDVALTVRDVPDPQPTRWEDGVTCALRARIPVVVAGDVAGNPFRALGAVEVDGEHVVEACEWVAASPSPPHTEVATTALLDALRAGPGDAEAIVRRDRTRLLVSIDALPSLDRRAIALAAPQVLTALRAYDPNAPIIDLCIEE